MRIAGVRFRLCSQADYLASSTDRFVSSSLREETASQDGELYGGDASVPTKPGSNVRVGSKAALTAPKSNFRFTPIADSSPTAVPILLQNSKVEAVQIFGENLKRREVDDSHSFSRATEVAYEFGARS